MNDVLGCIVGGRVGGLMRLSVENEGGMSSVASAMIVMPERRLVWKGAMVKVEVV